MCIPSINKISFWEALKQKVGMHFHLLENIYALYSSSRSYLVFIFIAKNKRCLNVYLYIRAIQVIINIFAWIILVFCRNIMYKLNDWNNFLQIYLIMGRRVPSLGTEMANALKGKREMRKCACLWMSLSLILKNAIVFSKLLKHHC